MGWRHIVYTVRSRLFGEPAAVVPIVRLFGPIDAARRFNKGLSATSVEPLLVRAFDTPGAKAVALSINSPGGAVVQSARIAARIRALAQEKDIPVLAFAEDVAASGGYMIALAGDEIFVHEASLVGSIGVVAGGFGLDRLLERFGVDRRLYTAGERKGSLDPFQPEKAEEVERFGEQLEKVHDYFKDFVRDRRGKRLKPGGSRHKAFSGDVFLGQEALDLGLVDGFGDVRTVLKARFGERVRMPIIQPKQPLFKGLGGMQSGMPDASVHPASLFDANSALAAVEERMIWSQFGL